MSHLVHICMLVVGSILGQWIQTETSGKTFSRSNKEIGATSLF